MCAAGWGWALLGLYAFSVFEDTQMGTLGDALWVCHLSNLLMGLGILLRRPGWIRVAMLWLLAGTPLWLQEACSSSLASSSYACHVGGLVAGCVAMRAVRAAWDGWWQALLGWWLAQALSRLCTPASLNVNVSWRMQGMEGVLGAYWQYWAVCGALAGVIFYGLQGLMYRLWPPRGETDSSDAPRLTGKRLA